jgi:TolA-binding protein
MKMSRFSLFLVFFFFFLAWKADCQTPASAPTPVGVTGDSLYQQALDTYLNGDYDQAIVLAAKSVQADPQNQKAQNLLTLLTNEKKDIGKYEIWLSGQAAKTAGPIDDSASVNSNTGIMASGIQDQIQKVQQHFNSFYTTQTRENGQFQGQIQAVSELLRENSNHQYDELRKSQNDLIGQVQVIGQGHDRSLWILYFLCFMSMSLSFCALWAMLRGSRGRA